MKLQKNKIPREILNLLKDKNIFNKYISQFDKKCAGEKKAKSSIFLNCCSIYVENTDPENSFINAKSSAGKSFITRNIYDIFPDDRKLYRSKISKEAFTYWFKDNPNWDWDEKLLYLEEVRDDLINSETFRAMLSEGSSATVVIKQKAVDIKIRGRPCILLTTANANPNIECLNRFNLIPLDESQKQTQKVKKFQSRLAKRGYGLKYDPKFKKALSYLKRIKVKILFASKTSKHFPNSVEIRRDYPRFIGLIKCSAALHQFQRRRYGGYIIADGQDYEIARRVYSYTHEQDIGQALTHKQKNAYETCKKLTKEKSKFSVREIYCANPFCSLKTIYELINDLTERGLLTTSIDDSMPSRPLTLYSVKKGNKIKLPSFHKLFKK